MVDQFDRVGFAAEFALQGFLRVLLLTVLLVPGLALAESPLPWRESSLQTASWMAAMDQVLLRSDSEGSFNDYLALFDKDVRAFGLEVGASTNWDGLAEHYRPVFFDLEDGIIISDEVIVAGKMAAQRYHSMFYLAGNFDGVSGNGQPLHIRGQTFFEWNESGRIARRWSNHDHGFRMEQMLGESGKHEGDVLARQLNGPGVSEDQVILKLEGLNEAHNRVTVPKDRERGYLALFSDDVQVNGIDSQPVGKPGLQAYMAEIWLAFPDLVRKDQSRLSAWGFAAVRWQARGSFRSAYHGQQASMKPAELSGQMILKFNSDGLISEAWINDSGLKAVN